jgi:hypothetical protein
MSDAQNAGVLFHLQGAGDGWEQPDFHRAMEFAHTLPNGARMILEGEQQQRWTFSKGTPAEPEPQPAEPEPEPEPQPRRDAPTAEEVTALLGGREAMRELVKTALRFAAADIDHLSAHDHIEDDCGDYLHAAMTIATELHGAWHNSGEHGVSDVLIGWAQSDPHYSPDDNLAGADKAVIRMDFAGDGVCPEVDAAVMAVRDKALGLSVEEDE